MYVYHNTYSYTCVCIYIVYVYLSPKFFRKAFDPRSFTYDYCFTSLEPSNDTGTQEKVYTDLGPGWSHG